MNVNEIPARSYSYTPAVTYRLFKRWFFSSLSGLLSGRRFVSLTPPGFRNQLILDRNTRKSFALTIRNPDDWETLQQIYIRADYDLSKLTRSKAIDDYYHALVSKDFIPLILDCGANIGLAARYFSQMYPEARIIAIEPDAGNIEQARLNNNSSNVSFVQAAIASSNTRGKLITAGLGNNAFRVSEDREGTVLMISINSLLDDFQTKKEIAPFIVKIDIEGYERELFSRNTEWIDKFPVLIIELHDRLFPGQANSRSFLSAISALDRDFVYYGEDIFSISNRLA